MASLHGRAEVSHVAHLPDGSVFHIVTASDSSRLSHDAPSPPWLAHGPSAASTTDERPPKRRKVDDDCSVLPPALDDDKSIVLAKVSLDLAFPTHGQADNDAACIPVDPHSPFEVSLESFKLLKADVFRIVVWNANTTTGIQLDATADPAVLQCLSPHLRAAATLATTCRGKKSKPVSRAAFCRSVFVPTDRGHETRRLDVELRWTLGLSVVEDPAVKQSYMKADLKLLSTYFPAAGQNDTKWALSDFYDTVYVPPLDYRVSPRLQHSLTRTTLYPFQQRAVTWLLQREGVKISDSGEMEHMVHSTLPTSFRKVQDTSGKDLHVSQLRGLAIRNLGELQSDMLQSLQGGILAEEMGLGKTVELITLISLHKRIAAGDSVYDAYTGAHVRPSSATLIITPPAILDQWISELHTHAPELKVLHYKGLPSAKTDQDSATVEHLLRYDVVLTTYHVLSREIHHAVPPPDRQFRNQKRYKRRESPLVGISWWRVCLDEAQMVESGVSQAATVARIIPRCNAWAVSGTPLQKNVQDLRGLLLFLRCDAFANNKMDWDRLDKESFKGIFSQLALRHTKDKLRDELRLPPQKRIVITVPFTAIEEQHYTELMRQMCEACWLTPEGNPLENRDLSEREIIERMRDWLVRLRQTCLHANVGRKNRKALGAKSGALRTVHEVLEVMIEQNDANWKSDAREMILSQINLGHVKAYAGDLEDRAQLALPYYEEGLKEAQLYVATCRQELVAELQKLGRTTDEGHGAVQSDPDDENEKEGDNIGRLLVIKKSLRSFLELEHACNFFIATTHHQIKENEKFTQPESEDYHRLDKLEVEWYEKAKSVRREILTDFKSRAQQQMSKVDSKKPFHQIFKIDDLPGLGGIEARAVLEMMDTISDFLNAQAEQIQIWRMQIVEILLMRLVDDDDDQETTGEEYDDSLKAQDELYVYIMALRTFVADRSTAVHGLQDNLVDHELKAAEKQALKKDDEEENRGHAPELVIEVANLRRKFQAMLEGGSLKGVVSGIRSLILNLQFKADMGDNRSAAELDVVQTHFVKIQSIVTQQTKVIAELEKELEMFRGTMNQRLEYYRQFQHISDTVAKYKEELDENFDQNAFGKLQALRIKKKDAVAGFKTKCTYLTHLRSENQKDATADCIICQYPIEIGVLTACGHKYCKECINQWWLTHRTCPLCKQRLSSSEFKDITFKPSEIKAQEETHEPESPAQASTPGSSSMSIYSGINAETMKEIKMIDLNGSYGTKIDMIARHLIWIRKNDPGAKSIIFSQFGDFLDVLRDALKKWKIGVSGITEYRGIHEFKNNPAIECFLLDAKSDSSGLNLVNATYVFLCEPLINPAIELQAIARVHRIGQQRPTTVFMYLVSDTVEEAIYEISVARRLEHMGKGKLPASRSGSATPMLQEKTLDAANTAEVQAAPLKQLLRKKGDGEIVQEDDLWNCLFGKPRKPPKPVLEMEVARHLRAEAAEERVTDAPAMDGARF
ncbi:hypothetical protein IQ07DRAFT_569576 [Pyrenochaeta sp. DS3sAY3a]|nr:hypothetical protein IQ07DRAFT_569576 [Pyrenochaeta sp. DS3sAY3a]